MIAFLTFFVRAILEREDVSRAENGWTTAWTLLDDVDALFVSILRVSGRRRSRNENFDVKLRDVACSPPTDASNDS